MINSKDFTKRLEKIMDFYALTASALADEIDFNRSTISHLVSGRNKPSLEFVMKLLQKFPEVDLDWLVLGKGNFPPGSVSKPIEKISKPTSSPPTAKSKDLFSEMVEDTDINSGNKSSHKKIERIAIFFSDGTFKAYEN